VLLFQVLVPIALYISLEGSRLFLALFIVHDDALAFVTEDGKQRHAECRSVCVCVCVCVCIVCERERERE
jgi:hypothetical protein